MNPDRAILAWEGIRVMVAIAVGNVRAGLPG